MTAGNEFLGLQINHTSRFHIKYTYAETGTTLWGPQVGELELLNQTGISMYETHSLVGRHGLRDGSNRRVCGTWDVGRGDLSLYAIDRA